MIMSSMRSTVMAASVANWIILTWERVGMGMGIGVGIGGRDRDGDRDGDRGHLDLGEGGLDDARREVVLDLA